MTGTRAESNLELSKRTKAVRELAISIGLSRVMEVNKQETHASAWKFDADISQRYISIDTIDLELYKMDLDQDY